MEKTNYAWHKTDEHDAAWYVSRFEERFGRKPRAARLGVGIMSMRDDFVALGIDNVFQDNRILDKQIMLEV